MNVKKPIAFILILAVSMCLLTGCGEEKTPPPESTPEALDESVWATYEPEFNAEQTIAMSNFMSLGFYLIEDDLLYGLTHSGSASGSLGMTPFYMQGDFPEFEETTILDGSGLASYLCKGDDTLYYIINNEKICRIETGSPDAETIYDGSCDYLQIHDGRLYFADENYHFVSVDLDGGDLQTVVDKEIYYPYFICSDWMIFQDDADGESLHLYNTTHSTELAITDVPAYNPIMDGNYLYYAEEAENGYSLCRVDMRDPDAFHFEKSDLPLLETGFMIDEEFFYTTNNNSVAKADWKKLTDGNAVTEEIEMYVSGAYTIHHEFDSEGLILAKYLMSKERGGGNSFR